MQADVLLKGGVILRDGQRVRADVAVRGGKILSVGRKVGAERVVDCRGLVLLPGLVDAHVHFRVPGHEWKEDWEHASAAALCGGVTTVLDMPNNDPPTCSPERLEKKRARVARSAGVDYGFFLGACREHADALASAANAAGVKLYYGESTASAALDEEALLCGLFRRAARAGLVVAVHAEDTAVVRENEARARREGWPEAVLHARIRSSEAEARALRALLKLRAGTGASLHVCHLSSEAGLAVLEKGAHPRVSCEVSPHHLFFTDRDVADLGNLLKVNPAIKGVGDRHALWRGLAGGLVHGVASDHAPHTLQEKALPYWEAPSGVPGVQTLLPVLLDGVNRGLVSLERVQQACCHFPARRFGIQGKGFLEPGYDADIVAVDPGADQILKNGLMRSLCGWTPWEGRAVRGRVVHTFLRGAHVVRDGALVQRVQGQEVHFIHKEGAA